MHTLSSARRTCMASASAVECTATVAIPSSVPSRRLRSAIPPRLAIRILSNIVAREFANSCDRDRSALPFHDVTIPRPASFEDDERLAELHGLSVLEQDLHHRAGLGRGDMVHRLHRLDDQQGLAL